VLFRSDAARRLLEHRISGLPVVAGDGTVVGIVSEGDLLGRVADSDEHRRSWWLRMLCDPGAEAEHYAKVHGRTVRDVMTEDIISIDEDMSVAAIARLLETKRIKRVPVLRQGKLVGVVSRADVLRSLAAGPERPVSPAAADDEVLRKAVLDELRQTDWAPTANLNVMVSDGVVSYWGFVDSPAQEKALRIAAESVPGVKGVEMNVSMLPYMGVV